MAAIPYPFRSAAHRADLDRVMAPARAFPLLRWFALLSAAAILFVSVTGTLFLDRFVERTSLLQSTDGLAQLVSGIVKVEKAEAFFSPAGIPDPNSFRSFLDHLGTLPGVLRANVYCPNGKVLWSSDPTLVGRRFAGNSELQAALAGSPAFSAGRVGEPGSKTEHARLGEPGDRYVENYLPVWSDSAGEPRVIGAVEFYRQPMRLLTAIGRTQQRIWWGALAVTILLYLALFVIVAHAACLMRRQQQALVATEQLVTAGEMASAVAHGLRNPLASIRSTAELGLELADPREVRELHAEVVAQADRLEGWIRQFLTVARDGSAEPAQADAGAVIAECADQFAPRMARRGVALEAAVPDALPRVRVGAIILRQVLNSLLANAVEAMEDGGRLSIAAAAWDHRVTVEVSDTGPGMSKAEVTAALSPFATTKPAGLGLGLPLARETVERHGGRLVVESRPGGGTTVRLVLPAVRGQAKEIGA